MAQAEAFFAEAHQPSELERFRIPLLEKGIVGDGEVMEPLSGKDTKNLFSFGYFYKEIVKRNKNRIFAATVPVTLPIEQRTRTGHFIF